MVKGIPITTKSLTPYVLKTMKQFVTSLFHDRARVRADNEPAIMALIVRGDSCLLARQPSWPAQMFSVLAGFVEPGESLEDAVHREVREEVGIEVDDVRYVRSQPWPFPSSLMLGFVMRAVSDEIQLGDDELEQARWVTVEQLRLRQDLFWPRVFSLAGQLIQLCLEGELSS